jgi:hypothetical protein
MINGDFPPHGAHLTVWVVPIQPLATRMVLALDRSWTTSTAVVIENEQPDCGREVGVEALATLAVDGRNEVADRSSLGISNALERNPEGALQGHAGSTLADLDASFDNHGFPARSVCGCCAHVIHGSPIVGGYPVAFISEAFRKSR